MAEHHEDLLYCAERVILDDGTLDMAELNLLLGLVLRDSNVDDEERQILAALFDELDEHRLSERVAKRIADIRRRYRI